MPAHISDGEIWFVFPPVRAARQGRKNERKEAVQFSPYKLGGPRFSMSGSLLEFAVEATQRLLERGLGWSDGGF